MGYQRVPYSAEVIVKALMGTQTVINTFYGQKLAGYTQSDLIDLAAAVDAWVDSDWLPQMPSNYYYQSTIVRGLDAENDYVVEDNTSTGAGTQATECPANNVAISVKRSSGLTGRNARGRIYVPVPEGRITIASNTVSSTWTGSLVTALEALDTAMNGVDFVPVIVHRVSSGIPLAEAVVYTLFEWVVVDLVLDSMRRRLPGRGG